MLLGWMHVVAAAYLLRGHICTAEPRPEPTLGKKSRATSLTRHPRHISYTSFRHIAHTSPARPAEVPSASFLHP